MEACGRNVHEPSFIPSDWRTHCALGPLPELGRAEVVSIHHSAFDEVLHQQAEQNGSKWTSHESVVIRGKMRGSPSTV